MKNKKMTFCLLLTGFISGCASVTTGESQTVNIDTGKDSGATCLLTNDRGVWNINSTPGSVTIIRSSSDLTINCSKANRKGTVSMESFTKGSMFGNIIAGGGVGAIIDCSTGAAYEYPTDITVPLK